jgi:hypothetical protein
MTSLLHVLCLSLLSSGVARAGDDDLDLDDELPLGDPKPAPAPAPVPPPAPDDGDEKDDELEEFRDTGGDRLDLEDEDPNGASGDSEALYRKTMERLATLDLDEQIEGWEQYLAQFPTTPYRTRIEKTIEDLTDQLYARQPGARPGTVDAKDTELEFSHPLQLENFNPRTRFQAAFEYGLPDYANLVLDYEHALRRNFSIHGGVRRRYLGFNAEVGARYAFVKSPRTQVLVTGMLDVRANANPFYPGIRPQLAVGKRFGKLDAGIIGGTDLTIFQGVVANLTGGATLHYAFSDRVGGFAETYAYVRTLGPDELFQGGVFTFDVLTFGLKFYPGKEGTPRDKEVNFGATVPYAQQYWQFHYGSIMGQFNYYP